jgi:hypothetical protein
MPAPARTKKTAVESEALPLEERIRRRAYELYTQRSNQFGSEVEDWLQAEDEILAADEQERSSRSRKRR